MEIRTLRLVRLCTAVVALLSSLAPARGAEMRTDVLARDNLVAWCVVPFDARKRGPEERAAMLDRLGIKRLAYDWRGEHVKTWDEELETLRRHGIELTAFWAPGEMNDDARRILELLGRHGVRTQLWSMLAVPANTPVGDEVEQQRRIEQAAGKLRPVAEAAAKIGCRVAIYNHGGWAGEPENQLAVIDRLARDGVDNVGIVYNLHHGHGHLPRFAELLELMKPHLFALNLNGMTRLGDRSKILPLGQGEFDLSLLKTIRESGWRGPVGILNHVAELDAEERLLDNLEGLDWLRSQLDGAPAGVKPTPRTWPLRPAVPGPAGASPK